MPNFNGGTQVFNSTVKTGNKSIFLLVGNMPYNITFFKSAIFNSAKNFSANKPITGGTTTIIYEQQQAKTSGQLFP